MALVFVFHQRHWTWSALYSQLLPSALMIIVGFKTRLFSVLSLVLLISLQNRTIINAGGDSLLSALLFWACFLPLGARYSLESVKNSLDLILDHRKGLANYHLSISEWGDSHSSHVSLFLCISQTGAEWQQMDQPFTLPSTSMI